MIKIEFTEKQIHDLEYERYHHEEPFVQRKMEAIILKSHKDMTHKKICEIVKITGNTLRSWLRDYQLGGIEKLKEINFCKPESGLNQHKEKIIACFQEHPTASVKEAMAKIEELTGIRRSENRIREFLKRIGLRRYKIGMIPAKADAEQQESFKKKELIPRLKDAESGQRVVFFTDTSHFVLSPFSGFLWSFTRIFIRAPSGRQRFNVMGALNAVTHELITVCNDSYINAESFCELLQKIAELHLKVPVTLILDNARYQKCRLVREFSESLNIELLYLPAYSPNLNLIERLWKFVKKKCLWSKYYSDFQTFKNAITECMCCTHTTYKKELDSLLTFNFQSFKKAQSVTV